MEKRVSREAAKTAKKTNFDFFAPFAASRETLFLIACRILELDTIARQSS